MAGFAGIQTPTTNTDLLGFLQYQRRHQKQLWKVLLHLLLPLGPIMLFVAITFAPPYQSACGSIYQDFGFLFAQLNCIGFISYVAFDIVFFFLSPGESHMEANAADLLAWDLRVHDVVFSPLNANWDPHAI